MRKKSDFVKCTTWILVNESDYGMEREREVERAVTGFRFVGAERTEALKVSSVSRVPFERRDGVRGKSVRAGR